MSIGTAGFTAALSVAALENHGVRAEQGPVLVTGVHTTAGPVAATAVVLAGGVWAPYLAKTVGVKVPLMPVVMSKLETQPVTPCFTPTIRAFGFGARQRPDGRTVVSAGLNA